MTTTKAMRYSCFCGRMFATKSGRTNHMRACKDPQTVAAMDRLHVARYGS